jgi:hypothetical protein
MRQFIKLLVKWWRSNSKSENAIEDSKVYTDLSSGHLKCTDDRPEIS